MGPTIHKEKSKKTPPLLLHASYIVGEVGDSVDGKEPRRQKFHGMMPQGVGFVGRLTYNAMTNSPFFLLALESLGLHTFPRIYVTTASTPLRLLANRVYLKNIERQTVECCKH